MEKNNQPIIITSIIVGAALIVALALVFTRTDSETEAPAESAVSENAENENMEGNGENGQQPTPSPTPQPSPQPIPVPIPTPAPNPQPGVLPSNWNGLTAQEKTDLNPFDCDHETQWVSAEDGTCIDKPTTSRPNLVGTDLLLGLGFDRCESPANSLLETYLAGLSERRKVSITELREQADEVGLPAVLSEVCVYSEDDQSDSIRVVAVEENVVDRLWDFASTNDYVNFFGEPSGAPSGFGSLSERIVHAGYRYVVNADGCDSSTPSSSLLQLMRLLDDQGYDYKYSLQGCYE